MSATSQTQISNKENVDAVKLREAKPFLNSLGKSPVSEKPDTIKGKYMGVNIKKKFQEVNLSFDDKTVRVYKEGNDVLSDTYKIVDYGPYGQGFGLKIESAQGLLVDWYYSWRDAGGALKLLGKEYWLESNFGNNEDVYVIKDNNAELFSAKVRADQFQYKSNNDLPSEALKLILVLIAAIKIRDEKRGS